jgi:phage major head subunit gpT-like protein
MAINLNAKFEAMDREVRALFAEALANKQYQPRSGRIIEEVDSDDLAEDYSWMLDTFGFRELKQNLPIKTAVEKRVTITNKPWVDNLTVDLRVMQTKQRAKYELTAKMMGRKVGPFIDNQVAGLIGVDGKAFTENSWDGVPFFSDVHPMSEGTTYSNLTAGAGAPWFLFDTSVLPPIIQQWLVRPKEEPFGPDTEWAKNTRQVKWDFHMDMGMGMSLWWFAQCSKAALDSTSFNAAMVKAMKVPTYALADGAAQLMGVMPNLLVVGPSNMTKAKELINASLNDGGGSNVDQNAVELLILPTLT